MRTWYDIKAKAGSADVYIYDEIGMFGVPASQFINEIRGLKGTLNLYINSPGGDVFDGIAIYNALSRYPGEVNVTVDALAASIASVVAQAGTRRTMSKSSAMMIHDAWGIAVGDPAEMEKMRDELDRASDSIADIYAERAGGTADEWRARMRDETWYGANEAVAAGLATDAIGSTQNAYSRRIFNLSKFNKVPDWVNHKASGEPEAQPGDLPATRKESEMSDLKEVREALGLDDEGDVIAAITSLQAEILSLKETIQTDAPEKGIVAQLRAEAQEANQRLISFEAEHNREILTLQEKVRTMSAAHKVDQAIAQGRVTPANRGIALKVAMNETDEGWEQFVKSLPSVNMREIGTAGADEDHIEPTKEEAQIAALMGTNIDTIRKVKAQK